MGLTQKLGTIPLAIFTDASNNIGIGGSPSGSYKFEVTGTARVSGLLTGANATFGSTGTGNNIIALSNNDQSNTRLRITNTGSGGQTFSIVGGNPGASNAGLAIFDETNSATRLYVSSAGNVGIGTSSPGYLLDVAGTSRISTGLYFNNSATNGAFVWQVANEALRFGTNDTERMRITSGGWTKISNSGVYRNASQQYHEINSNQGNSYSTIMTHTSSSTPYGLYIEFPNITGLGATNEFLGCADAAQMKAIIYGNGTFGSRTNTYGGISDFRLKENITPATSKLSDLMKVNIVNFNLIDDVVKEKQIGVIAQELEQIFPNMVYEAYDRLKEETYKGVKYSVFVPILIKAIQELSAKVSALEAKA